MQWNGKYETEWASFYGDDCEQHKVRKKCNKCNKEWKYDKICRLLIIQTKKRVQKLERHLMIQSCQLGLAATKSPGIPADGEMLVRQVEACPCSLGVTVG